MQKKILAIFLAVVMTATFFTAFAVPAAAAPAGTFTTDANGNIVIPYASTAPTLDGVSSAGEWDSAVTTTLTAANATWQDLTNVATIGTTYVTSVPQYLKDNKDTPEVVSVSYMWNGDGLYFKVVSNNPTPAWTPEYLSANNGVDCVQLAIDPTCQNINGQKSIVTLSPYSSFSGNGDSTVCQPGDSQYPDKPFWSELWGFCPEWAAASTEVQNGETVVVHPVQNLIPLASKCNRIDSTTGTAVAEGTPLDTVNITVDSYVLEGCITNGFLQYNDRSYSVAEGGTIRLGTVIADYMHRKAGSFTNTQNTGTYMKLTNFYGDLTPSGKTYAADESNGLGDSDQYASYVFGAAPQHTHSYTSAKHVLDSNPSQHIKYCDVCGQAVTEDCTFDDGVLSQDGTYKTYTCTLCGYSYTEDVPVVLPTVAITGTAQYGQTLTAVVSDAPAGATLHYQWKLDGANVGTDAATYKIYAAAIGKPLTVTVTTDTGVTATSEAVIPVKIPQAAPVAPVLESKTDTSVTLQAVYGREFSKDGINWQTSNVFENLMQNTEYVFYARRTETSSYAASEASKSLTVFTNATPSDITVTLSDNATYGSAVTATVTGAPAGATLNYQWYLDETKVGRDANAYTIYSAAYGKTIYCDVTINGTTTVRSGGYIAKKGSKTPPAAPVFESRTSTGITVTTVAGVEYSVDGINWQASGVFENLKPGTAYWVYSRRPGSANYFASIARKLKVMTALTGSAFTVTLNGTGEYLTALTASISGIDTTGKTVTYQWLRGDAAVGGNSASYTCYQADIAVPITVVVTVGDKVAVSNAVTGTKAPNTTIAYPPVLSSKTDTSITVTAVAGREYSIDGGQTWQTSNVFTGLTAGTQYQIVCRKVESKVYFATPASKALKVTTNTAA